MTTPASPKPISDSTNRNRWRRWLSWALAAVTIIGIAAAVASGILIPAANRIYFGIEERRINKSFRHHGINGAAIWQGREFDGVLFVSVSQIDDSDLAAVVETLKIAPSGVPLRIENSELSWSGLQRLRECQNLSSIKFLDTPISDAHLDALQKLMRKTRIRAVTTD
jgi:hypothetical protein